MTLFPWYRLWLLVLRQDAKFAGLNLRRLTLRNTTSRKPVVASRGPVVSIATYGKRIRTAYLALESIADGSVLPSRMILWVDDSEVFKNLPDSLRRLEERGLEIKITANYGPHKKYYPYLEATTTFDVPLVTADDDVVYPRTWLNGLVDSFTQNSAVVNCYRAHVMKIVNGKIAPYSSWSPCRSAEPSLLNFSTGVSGNIYPPAFLRRLKAAGKGFEQLCPKADDVWMHVNAIRSGFEIKQIGSYPLNFPLVPDTQDTALYLSNPHQSQNDSQIRNTYGPNDIDLLASGVTKA
jgi:hypothetical protein